VALVEALRELRDAKVSFANSDMKDEMSILVNNIESDVLEAVVGIKKKLSALLEELAQMKGAKKIAAYAARRHPAYRVSTVIGRDKMQGGRNGY